MKLYTSAEILRFSGFEEEWKENKLIEIGEVQDGSHETPQYFEKGVPFIRLQNIERNKFIYEDIRYISPEKAKQLNRHSFCPGDILFNKLGNPIGKTTIAPNDIGKGIIVSDVVKIRPKNDFNYNFVVEYLNSPTTERKIEIEMTGSTRKRLNLGQVKNLKIIYPKKDEQNKISNFLEKLNKKITLLENKHDYYQDFKKYLMQQIFAQKLRFADFNEEWNIVKLETLIKKGKAGGTPTSTNPIYYNGDIPFLSIADMTKQGKYIFQTEKTITEEGLNNSSAWIIPKNSLLFNLCISRLSSY